MMLFDIAALIRAINLSSSATPIITAKELLSIYAPSVSDEAPIVPTVETDRQADQHPFKFGQFAMLSSYGKKCRAVIRNISGDVVTFTIASEFLDHNSKIAVRRYPDGYRTVSGDHEVEIKVNS